jgi:demethylmenaquinone methyltransferase/2-methoxy-6-polyprenyl-1,4-benzoquinol methylase
LQEPESRDPNRIREMFGGIAPRYDLLNHLLSANLDRGWRRAAARRLPRQAERVLDLCGGTGDLSLELARQQPGRRVICCDFSHPMLVRAGGKFERQSLSGRCLTIEADGLRLPFPDHSFDAVTIAFGIRNLESMDRGLAEIHRALRRGGRLVVLEFSQPSGPLLSRLYGFYLRRVMPRLGNGINGRGGAYGYLARTIADFPAPHELADRITAAGFTDCEWERLTGGIVAVHEGRRRVA